VRDQQEDKGSGMKEEGRNGGAEEEEYSDPLLERGARRAEGSGLEVIL
jgi:hypothetical protein